MHIINVSAYENITQCPLEEASVCLGVICNYVLGETERPHVREALETSDQSGE